MFSGDIKHQLPTNNSTTTLLFVSSSSSSNSHSSVTEHEAPSMAMADSKKRKSLTDAIGGPPQDRVQRRWVVEKYSDMQSWDRLSWSAKKTPLSFILVPYRTLSRHRRWRTEIAKRSDRDRNMRLASIKVLEGLPTDTPWHRVFVVSVCTRGCRSDTFIFNLSDVQPIKVLDLL